MPGKFLSSLIEEQAISVERMWFSSILFDIPGEKINSFGPKGYHPEVTTFAVNGLFLGLVSMDMIHRAAERLMKKQWAWLLVVVTIGLSSFGIYMGRFLRWNSWDLLTETSAILHDFSDRFLHPLSHGRTWGMTFMLGGLFFCA